ncbi:MAG: Fatty acid hydroxylase superfamily protein [Verrucomicrobiales bacterium]|nr:Fatty acid hydroxylase superfamily protein [Verrucomicrobiales bacterium]
MLVGFSLALVSQKVVGFAQSHELGLFQWIHLSSVAQAILTIVIFDLVLYGWHWANHWSRFLWRFHRTHHSDREMDATSAFRFHFGEIAMAAVLRVGLIFLLGPKFNAILLYETLLFCVVQFHHSNISLGALDKFLAVLIVTPDIHRVHHSRVRSETDSNYSSLLSVWDRVFRTRNYREDQHEIELGLRELGEEKNQTVSGLLKTPLQ